MFHVGAKTKIVSKGAQQEEPKGATATEQRDSKFKKLRVGQLVRVVYREVERKTKKAPKAELKQKAKPKQKAEPKQKPKPEAQ